MSEQTGHPEIDRQHDQLEAIIARLGEFCQDGQRGPDECPACPAEHRATCSNQLADLVGDLLGFMIEHFSYEEKLMRFLPDTPACREHVEAHQRAHGEISRLLSELTLRIDQENPRQTARHLQDILVAWMGGHTQIFDSVLAGTLEGAYSAEFDYDRELIRLLASS